MTDKDLKDMLAQWSKETPGTGAESCISMFDGDDSVSVDGHETCSLCDGDGDMNDGVHKSIRCPKCRGTKTTKRA